jgi:membrane-bound metal-dependent hydrolase YbcI (DUF457 family)
MPSPIGHGLAGLAIANAGKDRPARHSVALFAAAALLACVPDVDLAIDLLIGADRFHHGPAHSLTFAFVAALLVATIVPGLDGRRVRMFLIAFGCVASHGLLDMLRAAETPRAGVQYLWPVSDRFLNLPWHVLRHAPELDLYTPAGAALFLARNIVIEIVVIGPFLALTVLWNRIRQEVP